MEDAGQKLKKARERLGLRYRDVEEGSQKIAARHSSDEFVVPLSRLADIENKGVVPSIFKLYTLSAIYRLKYSEVLEWYGIKLSSMPSDSTLIEIERTHLVGFDGDTGEVQLPFKIDPTLDLRNTAFLTRMVQKWGRMPLLLLDRFDLKSYCYGYIGTSDWTMYPLIRPGSLVVIDDTKRTIETTGWQSEYERPIYFVEHRQGWACGFCMPHGDNVILQPHPASPAKPTVFGPSDFDVIGLVTGAAMPFDPRRRDRS
jgi:hypothetical protein